MFLFPFFFCSIKFVFLLINLFSQKRWDLLRDAFRPMPQNPSEFIVGDRAICDIYYYMIYTLCIHIAILYILL